ncbi:MAG: hypothetical protein LBM07_02485 [Culturomica sp.]|jgi:hypothetical protein|nr:hypothetical protein [Culturomica sp.]
MKTIIIIVEILLASFSLFGQDKKMNDDKRKEFEAQKVAYFTNYLKLSSEEAAVFWTLYNEMTSKMKENNRAYYSAMKAYLKDEQKNNDGAKTILELKLSVEQKNLDLKKEYYLRMSKSLPMEKILKIDIADHSFNKQLLNKMCKHHDDKK